MQTVDLARFYFQKNQKKVKQNIPSKVRSSKYFSIMFAYEARDVQIII